MPQGSPEWFEARRGIPTASNFSKILAKGEGKTRMSYMVQLAGEIITGEPADTYKSADMERGNAMEPEARDFYAFINEVEPQLVGFITNGAKGGSPDALIGNDGALEIKTCKPSVLIDLLRKDQYPPEHKAQGQGNIWVAERDWIDIECFWPKMPTLIKRAYRDDAYIKTLAEEVDRFNNDLTDLVEKIRRYETLPTAVQPKILQAAE
jgi:hypothetical protein